MVFRAHVFKANGQREQFQRTSYWLKRVHNLQHGHSVRYGCFGLKARFLSSLITMCLDCMWTPIVRLWNGGNWRLLRTFQLCFILVFSVARPPQSNVDAPWCETSTCYRPNTINYAAAWCLLRVCGRVEQCKDPWLGPIGPFKGVCWAAFYTPAVSFVLPTQGGAL